MIHPSGSGLGQYGSILNVGPVPWAERRAPPQNIRRSLVMRAIYPHELLDSTGKEALKYLAQPNVVRILVSARAAFASRSGGQMHRVDTAVLLAVLALGGGFARAQQTPAAPNATAAVAIPAAVQVHIDHVMTGFNDTPGRI